MKEKVNLIKALYDKGHITFEEVLILSGNTEVHNHTHTHLGGTSLAHPINDPWAKPYDNLAPYKVTCNGIDVYKSEKSLLEGLYKDTDFSAMPKVNIHNNSNEPLNLDSEICKD